MWKDRFGNSVMKNILILGAGRGQVGLIKAAKKLGYNSVVVSIDGNYPGFKYADEIVYANIKDAETITKIAKDYEVCGIITAGMDMALQSLGIACEKNGLLGLNEQTSKASSNKLFMKRAFLNEGVNTAKFEEIYNFKELETAVEKIGFPIILKPVDLGGSRGINIVFQKEELEQSFHDTMNATNEDYCIVEEYIEGYEVSATAAMSNGKLLFVLPTADVRYGENKEIPIGHYVPLDCDMQIYNKIKKEVEKAILAIGIDNCVINADLMLKDDLAYVLELTGRLGANAIPEITSAYFNFDIHELIIDVAVGNTERIKNYNFDVSDEKICFGQMLISEKSGVLVSDKLNVENCEEWFFKKPGDKINMFRNPGDCIGQIVTIGKTVKECEERIGTAIKKLEVEQLK